METSQFHYGSIKTGMKYQWFNNKNSSQFHYGSIKTKRFVREYFHKWVGLNSTMVRLKLLKIIKDASIRNGLNSTMVRLKLK